MELRVPGARVTRILYLHYAQQHLRQIAQTAFVTDADDRMQEVGWALEQGQLDEVLHALHTMTLLEAIDHPMATHLVATTYRYFDQWA